MPLASKKQYDAEYWSVHRGVPGGSDAEHVATPAKGDYPKSAETLINKLCADLVDPHYGQHEDSATKAMRNGLLFEPNARKFIQFELDCAIAETGFWITDDGRFGCSPDGLIGDDGGIEFKVPDIKTHVKYLRLGELPADYKPQVHWSLIVTGRKWWKWVSWNHFLPPVIVHVEADDYTEKLRANMERFWREYQAAKELVFGPVKPTLPTKTESFGALGTLEIGPYDELVRF